MKSINGKFTHARYVNSQKDTIEALWLDTFGENGEGQYHQISMPVDLENPNYVKLLETFTTDEISTMTHQHNRDQEESFKNFVKAVALQSGLIYDPSVAEKETVQSVDHIFTPPEGDEGTDLLFNVKLKIFDMPEVVNSDNTELKRQLREADTPLKALYIAGKFLFE